MGMREPNKWFKWFVPCLMGVAGFVSPVAAHAADTALQDKAVADKAVEDKIVADKVTQIMPTGAVPVPVSEYVLKGDVALMIQTSEVLNRNTNKRASKSVTWQQVGIGDDVADDVAQNGMTILMPREFLQQFPKPYGRFPDTTGKKETYFLLSFNDAGESYTQTLSVLKYDARNRIGVLAYPELSTMRYAFKYAENKDRDEPEAVKLVLYNYRQKQKAIEIADLKCEYEKGKLVRYVGKQDAFFFGNEYVKTEFSYDENGFLTSMTSFDDPAEHEPDHVQSYKNYECDNRGNWTRRDVFIDEQARGTETRELFYAGDTLPAGVEQSPEPENPETQRELTGQWCERINYSTFERLSERFGREAVLETMPEATFARLMVLRDPGTIARLIDVSLTCQSLEEFKQALPEK